MSQPKPKLDIEPLDDTTIISLSTAASSERQKAKPNLRGKRPFPRQAQRQDKRPKNHAFEKREMAPSLSMYPCKQIYQVFTGTQYLPDIADRVYTAIHARIKTMPDVIDIHLFRYVISLAFYARLVAVNIHYGLSFPRGSSELKKATTGLQFPIVICQYIETLGLVMMQNGTKILPFVDDYRRLIPIGSEMFYDPLEAIQDARRPDVHNEWSIDLKWLAHYNTVAIPKLLRSGIDMRTILQESCEGKAELLISFKESEDQVEPLSPERQTLSVAHRGAAFRFRNMDSQTDWIFGDNWIISPQFTCEAISPDNILANIIGDSIKSSM